MRSIPLVGLFVLAACHSRPTPHLARATVAAACVNWGACAHATVSFCLQAWLEVDDPKNRDAPDQAARIECLAAAGHDCERVWTCLNGGVASQSCDLTAPATCKGDRIESCDPVGLRTVASVCRDGESCYIGTSPSHSVPWTGPLCGVGSCNDVSATCDGNVVQQCTDQVVTTIDCTLQRASCRTFNGFAECDGDGPACGGVFASRCDGDTLIRCTGMHEARTDCTDFGAHCFGGFGGYCGFGGACDPSNMRDTCDGNVLTYCDNGVVGTTDCVAAGFSGCSSANCQP